MPPSPRYQPGDRVRRPQSHLRDTITARRWVPSPYATVVRYGKAIVLPSVTGGTWRYCLSGDWFEESSLELVHSLQRNQ